jgi:hypothetical protein
MNLLAEYRVADNAPWRDCRIVGVFEHGATVELHDLEPGESFRGRIDLEFSSVPQHAVGVVLRAQICRRSRQPKGLVVDVEFMPTGTDRINLLRLLA